jgi:hypothetical protein
VSLRHKEYYIFNQPHTKESYLREVLRLEKNKAEVTEQFEDLKRKTPRLYRHELNTENCFGDYMKNCKNVYWGFDVTQKVEDSAYVYNCLINLENCYDCYWMSGYGTGALMYESVSIGRCYNCNFCLMARVCRDCEFLYECFSCDHCFLCVYLKNKEYHILNQPYSKEEYFQKVSEIKAYLKSKNMYGLDLMLATDCKV